MKHRSEQHIAQALAVEAAACTGIESLALDKLLDAAEEQGDADDVQDDCGDRWDGLE